MQAQEVIDFVRRTLPTLRKPLQTNIGYLTHAFLTLSAGVRIGNGKLSLRALARAMASPGTLKSRVKRLYRLLCNKFFTPEALVPELIRLLLGTTAPPHVPILIDQTTIGDVQALMAGVIFSGRVLPVAFACFTYDEIRRSQNAIETAFMTLIRAVFPYGSVPVFIADRHYGRLQLIRALKSISASFLLRTKGNTLVQCPREPHARAIHRLPHRIGKPKRYANVLLHSRGREPVDLVVYRGRGYQDVWYLVLPPNSERDLPTEEAVRLYRDRMQIEQGFRDWKTHLGIRGLQLEVDRSARLGRLLMGFALAYSLVILLGATPWADAWRPDFEIPRIRPRHGTCQTVSSLTLGMLLLGTQKSMRAAQGKLRVLLHALGRGRSAMQCAARIR